MSEKAHSVAVRGVEGNPRTVKAEVEVDASPEAVWAALTKAEELTRWFPLEAEVEPGKRLKMSWRGDYLVDSKIHTWEPGKKLAITTDSWGIGPLLLEYEIEGKGGRTIVRVVHSGFGHGDDWDAFYDGVQRGWRFELGGLKHYLEWHAGEEREVAWARQPTGLSFEEAWERVTGPGGLSADGAMGQSTPGEAFRFVMPSGDELTGTTRVCRPPRQFVATIDNWNNAYFRMEMETGEGSMSAKGTEVILWMSAYGVDRVKMQALESRLQGLLADLLAAVTA